MGIKTPGNTKSLYHIYNIQGEYRQSHYYVLYTNYSLSLLPIRTELQTIISNVKEADNNAICTNYRVARSSILLKLQLIYFPRSFPTNIMHYMLQNICPMLFRLWAKKFLKNNNANNYQERPSYHLSTAALKGLGNVIENIRP